MTVQLEQASSAFSADVRTGPIESVSKLVLQELLDTDVHPEVNFRPLLL